MLVRDIVHDLREGSRGGTAGRPQTSEDGVVGGGIIRRRSSVPDPSSGEAIELSGRVGKSNDKEEVDLADAGGLATTMEDTSSPSIPLEEGTANSSAATLTTPNTRPSNLNRRMSSAAAPPPSTRPLPTVSTPPPPSKSRPRTLPSLLTSLSKRFPTPSQTFGHLPFPLLVSSSSSFSHASLSLTSFVSFCFSPSPSPCSSSSTV